MKRDGITPVIRRRGCLTKTGALEKNVVSEYLGTLVRPKWANATTLPRPLFARQAVGCSLSFVRERASRTSKPSGHSMASQGYMSLAPNMPGSRKIKLRTKASVPGSCRPCTMLVARYFGTEPTETLSVTSMCTRVRYVVQRRDYYHRRTAIQALSRAPSSEIEWSISDVEKGTGRWIVVGLCRTYLSPGKTTRVCLANRGRGWVVWKHFHMPDSNTINFAEMSDFWCFALIVDCMH